MSETAPIKTLLLKHPRQAWGSQENVRRQWKALGYGVEPDFSAACDEYDAFLDILRPLVGEILFLPADGRTGLDSIYVRDAAATSPRGLIIGRMGKALRAGEPEALAERAVVSAWPVAGRISAPGTLEGGDVVWLDRKTVAVGLGYRTNAEGARQFHDIVALDGCEVVEAPLPHWNGPGDVLHLMSLLSPVTEEVLLVYSRLLPVPFRRRLLDSGFTLLEVPDEEFATMGANVLALGKSRVLALRGNPRTARVLEKAGLEVLTYEGRQISLPGSGGPTCLTRPLERE